MGMVLAASCPRTQPQVSAFLASAVICLGKVLKKCLLTGVHHCCHHVSCLHGLSICQVCCLKEHLLIIVMFTFLSSKTTVITEIDIKYCSSTVHAVNFHWELVLENATWGSFKSPLISISKYTGNPEFCVAVVIVIVTHSPFTGSYKGTHRSVK